MDFEWVAIALGDVTWISLAFFLGYVARLINLPPLVGFLATGFLLNYLGFASGETLQKLADLGITLLLFTVGLKLNLKVLIRPQVWSVTVLHISIIVALFGAVIFALAMINVPLFSGLDLRLSLLIAFALSFSSTVFVVKSLEDKGEMKSLHGRIAIGILVMQDIAAVIFLAASTGKIPSPWALLLFLLIPLRPLFHHLLQKTGHGELSSNIIIAPYNLAFQKQLKPLSCWNIHFYCKITHPLDNVNTRSALCTLVPTSLKIH